MTPLILLLWMLNAVVDTTGHISFKAAAYHSAHHDGLAHWKHMLTHRWIWFGVISYIAEFFLWTAFLSLVPLSRGVMLGSINIVIILLAGRIWFKEKMTPWRIAGVLLITFGVAIVGIEA